MEENEVIPSASPSPIAETADYSIIVSAIADAQTAQEEQFQALTEQVDNLLTAQQESTAVGLVGIGFILAGFMAIIVRRFNLDG